MIRVHFDCEGSLPALIMQTTDKDEGAFLKVFAYQISDGLSKVHAMTREDSYNVTPVYGAAYTENETTMKLSLLPVDLD